MQNIEYIQTEFKNKEKEIDYILEEVYEKIKKIANDDENVNIYIDMAGGRRDYFVFLQLFTKLLSFNGYSTHVFYSNITGSYCKITNVDLTFKHMKFLDAVNEFVTTGNARLLKSYNISNNTYVKNLVEAMVNFSDSIQLCSTDLGLNFQKIADCVKIIETKCDIQTENLYLIKTLIPIIKKKLHFNNKNYYTNIFGIIKWCLENRLAQQAVTIFNEYAVDIIFKYHIINVIPSSISETEVQYYKDNYRLNENQAIFTIIMSTIKDKMQKSNNRANDGTPFSSVFKKAKNREMEFLLSSYYLKGEFLPCKSVNINIDTELLRTILMDIRFAKSIRNTINHADNQLSDSLFIKYMGNYGCYKTFYDSNSYTVDNIIADLSNAVTNFERAVSEVNKNR